MPKLGDQVELVRPYLTCRTIKQERDLFLVGTNCPRIGYIKRGSCYRFQRVKGKVLVDWLFVAGDLVLDLDSFLFQRPTDSRIKVNHQLELEEISYLDLQRLYGLEHEFEKVGRQLAERGLNEMGLLYWSVLHESPQVRYERIVRERPQIIQQFPQYLIASYLGITPVGLSKIRKRMANRVLGQYPSE